MSWENGMSRIRTIATRLSTGLNRIVEVILIVLMAALVIDVWLGVMDRYFFKWQLTWPETMARYLMIWTVLLAISSGISRREHIGLTVVIDRLPDRLRRTALVASDVIAICLFFYLFWFGIDFMMNGFSRMALIFGASLGPFHAAIPVSALLALVQLVLAGLRDLGDYRLPDQANEA